MRSVTKKLIKFSLRKKLSSIKREGVFFITVIGGISRPLTRDILKNFLSKDDKKIYINQPGFNHNLGLPLTVFGAVQRVGTIGQWLSLLFSKFPVKPGVYVLEYALSDESKDLDFLLNDCKPDLIAITDFEDTSYLKKDYQKYLLNLKFILEKYSGFLIYPKDKGYDLFENYKKIGEYDYEFKDNVNGQIVTIKDNSNVVSLEIDGHGEAYSKAMTVSYIVKNII